MSTPRRGHEPIRMSFASKGEPADVPLGYQIEQEGAFYWDTRGGKRTLCVAIPVASKPSGWCYSRWTVDHPNEGGHQWSWDGNEEAPTLQPSIHAVGVWHGFVRGGFLVEA